MNNPLQPSPAHVPQLRRPLIAAVAILFAGCGGCSPYLGLKSDLLIQADRAVATLEQSSIDRQRFIDDLREARVDRLNEAFDADVRNQNEISPAWVIDHRRAYAVGFEAIERSTQESRQSLDADLANARAARTAILQLRILHDREADLLKSIPSQLSTSPGNQP